MERLLNAFEYSMKTLTEHSTIIFQTFSFLILGYIAAKVISKIIIKLIRKFISKKFDYVISEYFPVSSTALLEGSEAFVFWFVCTFFLIAYLDVVKLSILGKIFEWVAIVTPNILMAVILLVVGYVIGVVVRKILLTSLINLQNRKIIASLAKTIIIGIAFTLALEQIGVKSEAIIVVFAIILFCLLFGFALLLVSGSKLLLQNYLSNQLVGNDIKVGDYMQINGIQGKVLDIGKFHIMLQEKNNLIRLPGKFLQEHIAVIKLNDE